MVIDPSAFVHDRACVDETVRIGARARVWQFATVIRGASIGADCNVASGACVDGSVIGAGSIICQNVAMGSGFLIGRGCFIGPNVTLCNDAFPRAHKEGWTPDAFDGSNWAIVIEDGASIGANAVILPGVRIGAGAMIAAGAVISRDVPPRCIATEKGVRSIGSEPMTTRRLRFARYLGRACR